MWPSSSAVSSVISLVNSIITLLSVQFLMRLVMLPGWSLPILSFVIFVEIIVQLLSMVFFWTLSFLVVLLLVDVLLFSRFLLLSSWLDLWWISFVIITIFFVLFFRQPINSSVLEVAWFIIFQPNSRVNRLVHASIEVGACFGGLWFELWSALFLDFFNRLWSLLQLLCLK